MKLKKLRRNNKKEKGITLIALVVTIVVLLILAGVTINIALNEGLFSAARDAKNKTQTALDSENKLSTGRIKVGETWYDSIQDYADNKPSADQTDSESGSSSGEEKPKPTQEYTWEKYSFVISGPANSGADRTTLLWISNTNSVTYNESKNINAYGKIKFLGSPYLCMTTDDLWTGNLKEYYCGQYKNYPFIEQSACCTGCSTDKILYYQGEVHSINSYNNFSVNVLNYAEIDKDNTISTITKGTYKYGEVQSTDSTAYPQNGFQDGYWYVLKQT